MEPNPHDIPAPRYAAVVVPNGGNGGAKTASVLAAPVL